MMNTYGRLDVCWSQGYKGDEISYVDSKNICFACGSTVKFVDVANGEDKIFHSPGNGVNKVVTNPSHELFALSEVGLNPRIFICRYPSFEVVCELAGGAELNYTNLAFGFGGTFIAATSGLPDFTLFLWDWSTGNLLCKEKLLSEDEVTSLLFNPLNKNQLSLIGPNKTTVWTIQECNDVYTLRSKKIYLPTTDGILTLETDDLPSRSATRAGYYISISSGAKAGLYGEKLKNFTPPEQRHPRVVPTSQCWSSKGDVYVGCADGQLFKVDGETGNIVVLLGGMTDYLKKGEVEQGMFQSMALNAKGILAGGHDGVLRLINIANSGITIDRVWKGTESISVISFSPKVYMELTYGTATGSIYRFNTVDQKSSLILETGIGRFVGVSYGFGGKFCVTCRENGELQIWDSANGEMVGNIVLDIRATCVAFCPSCPVVAVGTKTGHICYVDVSSLSTEEVYLRQVDIIRMHHGPVTFLQYDSYGTFLLSACSDETQLFIINARPSAAFQCIGYIDCKGHVSNVSIYGTELKTMVVAVATPHPESSDYPLTPNILVMFTLAPDIINAPDEHYCSLRHDFKDSSIGCVQYRLTVPVDAVVITSESQDVEIAGLHSKTKRLLRFVLPKEERQSDSEEPNLYSPVSEYSGQQLGGGILTLSAHGQWLASSSVDGFIIVRDLKEWDSHVMVHAHSYIDGGTKDIAFSPDAKLITSVGKNDGSLVCFKWNFTGIGSIVANSGVEFARIRNLKLRSNVDQEMDALYGMGEWSSRSRSVSDRLASPSVSANILYRADEGPILPDDEEEEHGNGTTASGGASEVAMTPVLPPGENSTWLDNRIIVAVKHENSKYTEMKKDLRRNIKDLRKTILEMMETNDSLPEIEQLRHDEFNLDSEEQKRMQKEEDEQVQKVRDDINLENLSQRFLAYLIKKECWDDMATKGRALKTFNSNVVVNNYPTRPVTSQETADFRKVKQIRTIEMAEIAVRKKIVEISTSTTSAAGEEEEEEEEDKNVCLSLHGSLGPRYSGDCEFLYSQFDLHTREEKMCQIILLQNAIRRVKDAFNDSFSSVYRNKELEIARIKERNVRIRAIMRDLDMDYSSVIDPEMEIDEMPEKSFVVSDDEVKVERVLSEEQKREKEELERIEEEKKAAAKGDNKRERALVDMMGGVLEVKKEDILKQNIAKPDFVEEKLEKDWTDEEKKKMKEFEKKVKDLQEEREKYRKNLENELKKLQQSNVDGMASFDDSLSQLFARKVKVEMVVNQEELKIHKLTSSVMTNDELSIEEAHLNALVEMKTNQQIQAAKTETEIRKKVEEYREVYDSVVAEDKMLDRGFKREFSDVPLSISDHLYKLFKRRPRIQRHKQAEENKQVSQDPYGLEKVQLPAQYMENIATLDALIELDAETNMPEGVEPPLWQRLCDARRAKVESELRVKQSALTLAEMSQYLQHRQEEHEKLSREIDDITKRQTRLCDDVMKHTLNLEVELLLKQGQVEVMSGEYIPDYSDGILIHRGVVEDLNGTIRTLGESKVAAMTESKDFKKGIHQLEWERKRMIMQMEDLHNRSRHIQMLKLTKDLQAFLNEENYSAKQSKEVSVLEQTLALQDKQLEKHITAKEVTTAQLKKVIRTKEHENIELDKVLQELHVSVSERQNIAEVNAGERAKHTVDKRLRGIVQRRKLVDLAKAQAQEVAVLRAEVERLRMKTFPALVQVER